MANKKIDFPLADRLRQSHSRSQACSTLFDFMEKYGQSCYEESVTQLEHALQAACLARASQAESCQVVAALLHDIGHFLMDEQSSQGDFMQEDWCHESIGADHLAEFFDPEVIGPIRLHVPAKRYLCTVDQDYYEKLSHASRQSFRLQGGEMSEEERAAFEANPSHASAVLLRGWDDRAKESGLKVPHLESYRAEVVGCLLLS